MDIIVLFHSLFVGSVQQTILALVLFPGFSPELWAERAPMQDSRRVPHRRAHTNKSHCSCAGGCGNAVTLPPTYPTILMIITISVFLFSSHPVYNLPQNEWAVLSFSCKFNKCCSPLTFSLTHFILKLISRWNSFLRYVLFRVCCPLYFHACLTITKLRQTLLTTCYFIVFERKHFGHIIQFADRREWADLLNHVPGKLLNAQCKTKAPPLGLSPG